MIINGTIDNPVGITRIYAAHGDILSTHARGVAGPDGRFSLIITNVIDLQAPNGSVGKLPRINVDIVYSAIAPAPVVFKTSQVAGPLDTIFAGPSQLFNGALVKYTTEGTAIGGLTPGAKYTVILNGITIQLAVPGSTTPIDLEQAPSAMATRHFLTPQLPFTAIAGTDVYLDVKGRFRDPAVTTYTVIVDNVRAGRDADILMQPSVRETTVSSFSGGVLVKWPVVFDGLLHYNFFTPDDCVTRPCPPPLDAGIAGGGAVEVPSTYDFRALDAFGARTNAGVIAGRNILIYAAQPSPSATTINVIAITDALDVTPGYEDIVTNGSIDETEKNGDLRVGRIDSSNDDTTIHSPRRILDFFADFEADVVGNNITMTAGNNGLGSLEGTGGIGHPGNFLEINVDQNLGTLGVLNAFDTAAASTLGVFLTETTGDMKIHTVTTNGDASLVTRAGSLVDARNGGAGDDAADVIANTVDLKAVGGNIGALGGGNDLEIDSSHGGACTLVAPFTCTIAAEATGSIFLTETFGAANVVLMAAYGTGQTPRGDVRLTVRESALSGENLNLLASGSTLVDEAAVTTGTSTLWLNSPRPSRTARSSRHAAGSSCASATTSRPIRIRSSARVSGSTSAATTAGPPARRTSAATSRSRPSRARATPATRVWARSCTSPARSRPAR